MQHPLDHRWNYEFVKLLSQGMAIAFTSRPPPYAAILDLDRKLRDFHVPAHLRLQWAGQKSSESLLWIKRWVVLSSKEWGKRSSLTLDMCTGSSCSTVEHPPRIFLAGSSRESPRPAKT
jgi:hypothetical protein